MDYISYLFTKTNNMNFFDRLSNGWNIAFNSLKVLKANKQLIIFPILSGTSLVLIMGSFVVAVLAGSGWQVTELQEQGRVASYAWLLGFYVVNYFVVVFFNIALIHCTRLYFRGEEVSIGAGLRFALSRLGPITLWALFAGTVGTILRVAQQNSGLLGKIVSGIVGIIWSVATFFVVPVIAYENVGPVEAVRRSSKLMKEKWGESIGATFSFGILHLTGVFAAIVIGVIIGAAIHPIAGFAVGALSFLLLMAVLSAAHTIFLSAVYHNVTGDPVAYLD